jgi:hypothetical protein
MGISFEFVFSIISLLFLSVHQVAVPVRFRGQKSIAVAGTLSIRGKEQNRLSCRPGAPSRPGNNAWVTHRNCSFHLAGLRGHQHQLSAGQQVPGSVAPSSGQQLRHCPLPEGRWKTPCPPRLPPWRPVRTGGTESAGCDTLHRDCLFLSECSNACTWLFTNYTWRSPPPRQQYSCHLPHSVFFGCLIPAIQTVFCGFCDRLLIAHPLFLGTTSVSSIFSIPNNRVNEHGLLFVTPLSLPVYVKPLALPRILTSSPTQYSFFIF